MFSFVIRGSNKMISETRVSNNEFRYVIRQDCDYSMNFQKWTDMYAGKKVFDLVSFYCVFCLCVDEKTNVFDLIINALINNLQQSWEIRL